ncbi:hypothetical protein EDC94DRAFT_589744 [Helicostylum pulchrum]|nr:hypothetical protein EDC94DRAFT_589744 [Helicostylum pulchrum]
MSDEYVNQLLKNADNHLLISAKAVNKRIKQSQKLLESNEDDDNNSSSSNHDNHPEDYQYKINLEIDVRIPGLDVTLGEAIANYTDGIKVNDAKSHKMFMSTVIDLTIISMHVERPWIFRKEAINNYSEADYQIKFWDFIFETFFSDNGSIVLHWGDTMTSLCKSSKLLFKLDLRLVIFNEEKVVLDGLTGELAKKATK